MRETSTCSQCGYEYTYPADMGAKTGMHCSSCGQLIDVKTGLLFGSASSAPEITARPQSPALPPSKYKESPQQHLNRPEEPLISGDKIRQPLTGTHGRIHPISWLAWLLACIALVLAFIFPSYGNDATDPLYMLQWLPTIIFSCTSAILFIQGLCVSMRR